MFNPFLTLFVFAELGFYLLIAQTGIVEVFHSDLRAIAFMPIGGVLGTYLVAKIKMDMPQLGRWLLGAQLGLALLYPDYTPLELFLLGFVVGSLSPIIIQKLKNATPLDLFAALGGAYMLGTLLFPSDPASRLWVALTLGVLALVGFALDKAKESRYALKNLGGVTTLPVWMMVLWVFLDSSLFETLSRQSDMAIWRGEYMGEIVLGHLLGIAAAIGVRTHIKAKTQIVMIGFILSYTLYLLHLPWMLSIVYPIVISYYNVTILQEIVRLRSFSKIATAMVFIGWGASGAGLSVALHHGCGFVFVALVLAAAIYLFQKSFKGVYQWSRN